MAIERRVRKALNIKQDNLEFHGNPSIGGMSDGQTAISKGNNGQLAIHRKKYGKLWKSYMSYNGIQYVDKDIVVKNDVVYNGFLRNQHYPAFKAYISTSADAQTIGNNTRTNVSFDSVEYDIGGNYDTSAYKFTAPVAGIYHFNAKVLWDNDTDATAGDWAAEERHDIYLIKNNSDAEPTANSREASELRIVSGGVTDVLMMNSINGDLKLDAGDFITVAVYQNTGTNQYTYDPNDGMWSSWSGHLITAI